MRQTGANYQEMFRKVKSELDAQIQGGAVRISRDKVNKVAHVVTDALAELDAVDFVEDRNTFRLEVRKILEDLLNQEAKNRPGRPPEDREPEAHHP